MSPITRQSAPVFLDVIMVTDALAYERRRQNRKWTELIIWGQDIHSPRYSKNQRERQTLGTGFFWFAYAVDKNRNGFSKYFVIDTSYSLYAIRSWEKTRSRY